MILREIRISNFKPFGRTITIPIRPITLIFGQNSAGKSAILQCLALLAQSLDTPFASPHDTAPPLIPKGKYVDLGRYQDIVYGRDTSRTFEIAFEFEMDTDELFDETLSYAYGETEWLMRDPELSSHADRLKRCLRKHDAICISFSFANANGLPRLSETKIFLDKGVAPILRHEKEGYSKFNIDDPFWLDFFNEFQEEINRSIFGFIKAILNPNTTISPPPISFTREMTGDEKHKYDRLIRKIENRIAKNDEDCERLTKIRDSLLSEQITISHLNRTYDMFLEDDEPGRDDHDIHRRNYPMVIDRREASPEEMARLRKLYEQRHLPEAALDALMIVDQHDDHLERLKRELRSGRPGYKIFLELYEEHTSYDVDFISWLHSSFLPDGFAGMTIDKTISKSYIETDKLYRIDWDPIHPGQITPLVAAHVKRFLESIQYIGPIRKEPDRYYIAEGNPTVGLGRQGENIAALLYRNGELVDRVNDELARIRAGYRVELVELSNEERDIGGVFVLRFIDRKTGIKANIKDVGFGFSQLLPIVVQSCLSFYANIMIEQPELHLHPAMQAELGDIFIRGALAREKEPYIGAPSYETEKRNTFILETHSEHLILRILRRIRETTSGELPNDVPPITPADVSILYVEPGDDGSRVVHIPVDEDGDFTKPWPNGFFAERAKELFQ